MQPNCRPKMNTVPEPYAPRPIRALGIRTIDDWRLKVYSIVYGPQPFDAAIYDDAIGRFAPAALPRPAVASARPGVGFVICHQGRGWHYLVLCWWDNENELPMRIWVRPRDHSADWRPARESESICVWDIQLIAAERDAYVRRVLSTGTPDPVAYLADTAGELAAQ